MIGFATTLFAVTLLLNPPEASTVGVSPSSHRTVGVSSTGAGKSSVTSARITSRTSDFDRSEGVIMFEGDVCVRYSETYTMCADRLYMFLSGTNELKRVVAIGSVSITNESRVGTCAMATYRHQRGEIEMFGDGKGVLARLNERAGGVSSLEGTRIKFWLGSEQTEVENSRIVSEGKGARKLL